MKKPIKGNENSLHELQSRKVESKAHMSIDYRKVESKAHMSIDYFIPVITGMLLQFNLNVFLSFPL